MTGLDSLPKTVRVCEVGPRDGLQNEPTPIPTEAKIHFIDLLSATGLGAIEVTSFVRPGAIPQLSDAAAVLQGINRHPDTSYTALVPNLHGMERATGLHLGGIALFTAASETFSRRNANASIDETLKRFRPVADVARRQGIRIRGYVSTAFGCPFEGDVPVTNVLKVALALFDLGVHEVAISDTIGIATPGQVGNVMQRILEDVPANQLALHFHDTRGTALANVLAGLLIGIETFDSSAGGLGGCPYAPGAAGNLATEDLVYMLDGLGIETGVSLAGVVEASRFLAQVTAKRPTSRYYRATVK